MTLNRRIIAALSPAGLPVYPDIYPGKESSYYTFHYDLLPRQPADNRPLFYLALIQVHLHAPLKQDTVSLRGQTVRLLTGNGFLWPEIVNATDENGQHFVFETEIITQTEET